MEEFVESALDGGLRTPFSEAMIRLADSCDLGLDVPFAVCRDSRW
jgi:hypothetical protein